MWLTRIAQWSLTLRKNSYLLYPGIVRRWVSESATEVALHTFGEIVGPMVRVNRAIADTLCGQGDENIFEYARI